MEPNKHYIKKQTIELGFHSQAAAEEPWASISDLHKGRGLQVMSEVFDQVAPPGTYIQVNKLEIDLGVISLRNFNQDYLEQLRSILEKKLKGVVGLSNTNIVRADTASVWESNILYYLKHGSFLWETAVLNLLVEKNDGLSITQILQEKILERMENVPGFRHSVQRLLLQDDTIMKRWVRQFSMEFLETVRQFFMKETLSSLQSLKKNSVQMVENSFHTDKPGEWLKKESRLFAIWSILCANEEQYIMQYIETWMRSISLPVSHTEQESIFNIIKYGTTEDRNELLVFLIEKPDLVNPGSKTKLVLPAWIQKFSLRLEDKILPAQTSVVLPGSTEKGNRSAGPSIPEAN